MLTRWLKRRLRGRSLQLDCSQSGSQAAHRLLVCVAVVFLCWGAMAPLKKLKNEFFFIIRDKPVAIALKIVKDAPMAHLTSCYKPTMQTPLFFACARAQGQDAEALALCKLLVGFGVTLHWVDEYQQTALYYAARQGHTKTCAYLVQQGIDVNHLDRNSETALFYAATRAHLDTALTLMDKHSRLDVVNRWGRNIVQVAAKEIGPKLQAEVTARKRKAQEISSPPPPAAAVSAVPLPPPLKRRRVAAMPLEAVGYRVFSLQACSSLILPFFNPQTLRTFYCLTLQAWRPCESGLTSGRPARSCRARR